MEATVSQPDAEVASLKASVEQQSKLLGRAHDHRKALPAKQDHEATTAETSFAPDSRPEALKLSELQALAQIMQSPSKSMEAKKLYGVVFGAALGSGEARRKTKELVRLWNNRPKTYLKRIKNLPETY